jgi:hypothetical protein
MIVPHKKVMEQIAACQPVKHSQPTIYDKNLWQLGGDHSETQWYWPPEVGALLEGWSMMYLFPWKRVAQTYIEAISAIERYTKEKPTNTMRNAQITPAVPPLVMIVVRVVSITSHVAIKVHANPTIEVNWKFLCWGMSDQNAPTGMIDHVRSSDLRATLALSRAVTSLSCPHLCPAISSPRRPLASHRCLRLLHAAPLLLSRLLVVSAHCSRRMMERVALLLLVRVSAVLEDQAQERKSAR